MKQIPITEPQMKWDFGDPRHWALTFKYLRCPEHNAGAEYIDSPTYNWRGALEIGVILEVCCDNFFNNIIEIERQYLRSKQNVQKLNEWYRQRAENNQNSEIIVVGGIEVRDVEIVDLWGGNLSGNGYYLILTGNRKVPIPPDEIRRVRNIFYHGSDVRKRNISGEAIYENELEEVIYEGETPFVRLTDNRLIEIKPVEVARIKMAVKYNKGLKRENISREETDVLQEK